MVNNCWEGTQSEGGLISRTTVFWIHKEGSITGVGWGGGEGAYKQEVIVRILQYLQQFVNRPYESVACNTPCHIDIEITL